jgi:hypothetical protein
MAFQLLRSCHGHTTATEPEHGLAQPDSIHLCLSFLAVEPNMNEINSARSCIWFEGTTPVRESTALSPSATQSLRPRFAHDLQMRAKTTGTPYAATDLGVVAEGEVDPGLRMTGGEKWKQQLNNPV